MHGPHPLALPPPWFAPGSSWHREEPAPGSPQRRELAPGSGAVVNPVPGLLVGENLRLVRELGRGGMGSVWVADHRTLGTQVAIKFLSAELASSVEARGRFTLEASTAARLKSQYVVQTYDHGITPDGLPYIVMELLDGRDLAAQFEQHGGLSVEETTRMVNQVCRALAKAHEMGLVHRDIKPDNVFLAQQDGEVSYKVLDFGIAKQSGAGAGMGLTTTGALMGTPYYMSPEQLLSARDVDARSDLWSLAVVVYQAVTGQRPFDAETIGGLCIAIDRCVFRMPTSVRQGLPPGLDAWFARALARDPNARFGSARELAAAFTQAASGMPRGAWPAAIPRDPWVEFSSVASSGRGSSPSEDDVEPATRVMLSPFALPKAAPSVGPYGVRTVAPSIVTPAVGAMTNDVDPVDLPMRGGRGLRVALGIGAGALALAAGALVVMLGGSAPSATSATNASTRVVADASPARAAASAPSAPEATAAATPTGAPPVARTEARTEPSVEPVLAVPAAGSPAHRAPAPAPVPAPAASPKQPAKKAPTAPDLGF